jgi:phosphoenolpyruvate carboxykinase (GTP)
MSDEDLAEVLNVDLDALKLQIPQMREFLAKFGDDLPDEIAAQLDALEERLAAA